jgi:hypothetical protein
MKDISPLARLSYAQRANLLANSLRHEQSHPVADAHRLLAAGRAWQIA